MGHLLLGILIMIVGLVLTTIGGYISKDGWEKMKVTNNALINKPSEHYESSGNNSPIIKENSGTVIINSTPDGKHHKGKQ